MSAANMHWDYILILTILAVIVPWRSSSRVRDLLDGPELATSERILVYLSTIVFQWIAVAVIAWRCVAHRLALAELGIALPYPARAASVAAGLSILLIFNQVYSVRRISALPYENRSFVAKFAAKLLPRATTEVFVAVLLVLTVAVCEEFIYRGFVETVFADTFSDSATAGAFCSAVFFASAHLYQGRKGLITTFAVGLIFSAARIWTGSLLPSSIVHFAVDFSAGLAAWKFLPLEGNSNVLMIVFSYVCGPDCNFLGRIGEVNRDL